MGSILGYPNFGKLPYVNCPLLRFTVFRVLALRVSGLLGVFGVGVLGFRVQGFGVWRYRALGLLGFQGFATCMALTP